MPGKIFFVVNKKTEKTFVFKYLAVYLCVV